MGKVPEELRRRAERGEAEAQLRLGQFILHARGSEDPEIEAFRWLERAAAQGHSEALYELGLMLLVGEGCTADVLEGVRRLEMAAMGGEEGAAIFLERVYRHGLFGIALDAARAADWAEDGALRRQARAKGLPRKRDA